MRDFNSQRSNDALARRAVQLWTEELTRLIYVQNSENLVYRFDADKQTRCYYLRVTHSEHRSCEQVLAELDFVLYLKQSGCHVSCPVPSLSGRLIEPVSYGETHLHVCVFEAAPGERVSNDFVNWDPSLFREWGRALGVIHSAAKSFVPSGVKRLRWNEDDVWLNARNYLPLGETAARNELEHVSNWLGTLTEEEEQFGLIHGDLCCANFHCDGRCLISFDFDDSVYHWFVYDLVCALAPMIFHPNRDLYRQWFIEGYEEVNSLPMSWQEEFNWFLRLRGLYLFILNLKDWRGTLAEHPKSNFLEILRRSFEQPIRW